MEAPDDELLITDEDFQCGHIYLHKPSNRMKFLCLFCEKIYNDILCYCDHLSEHIYGPEQHPEESYLDEHGQGENSFFQDFHEYVEEELDEEESRQFLFDNNADCGNNDDDYGVETDKEEEYLEKLEHGQNEEYKVKDDAATDFENLIGNAKILKRNRATTPDIKPQRQQIKQSKDPLTPNIQTLKVITLKNQLEALYSSTGQTVTKILHEANNAVKGFSAPTKNGLQRTTQIIGETVITSMPVEVSVPVIPKYYGNDEVKCLACNQIFRNQTSLGVHSRSHYLESTSAIRVAHKCTDCKKLFSKLKDLRMHIQKIHFPDGFKCRLCKKTMRTMPLLEVHMRKIHMQLRSFSCRLCGQSDFTSIEELEQHSKTHNNEEIFKCYLCGKQLRNEVNLRHHIQCHSNSVSECCAICGKITMRLAQHMKKHTPRPNRIIQCSICNKHFSFNSALSRHIKVMHKLPRTRRYKVSRKGNGYAAATRRSRKSSKQHIDSIIASATEEESERGAEQKKVVESIENVMNRTLLLDEDNITANMDCTVARYETIAAIRSITIDSN